MVHVDGSNTLLRSLHDKTHAHAIPPHFYLTLFDPQSITNEGDGTRLMTDPRLPELWYKALMA